ncbi:MAG: methylmalonyl Co-A mutase-associated GTPase MeaB [Calditrichota bacterium]
MLLDTNQKEFALHLTPERRLELARLLSRLDRPALSGAAPLPTFTRPSGEAFRIGVTGPVGAGKSTLINRLIREYRARNMTVGVIAVDPSSPFTGGAVLGDRIRMAELVLDEGVFIRSLATRGAFGGLAATAVESADLLEAFGFDRVIIETVGVGQTEVDIVEACDATVVVLEPASGDDVQAIKAGLMEIANLFIVNKMDIKGAKRYLRDLETAIDLRSSEPKASVLPVQAVSGEGMTEVYAWLEDYYKNVQTNGRLNLRRAGQRIRRIRKNAEEILIRQLWSVVPAGEVEALAGSELSLQTAAQRIADKLLTENG